MSLRPWFVVAWYLFAVLILYLRLLCVSLKRCCSLSAYLLGCVISRVKRSSKCCWRFKKSASCGSYVQWCFSYDMICCDVAEIDLILVSRTSQGLLYLHGLESRLCTRRRSRAVRWCSTEFRIAGGQFFKSHGSIGSIIHAEGQGG